MIEPWHLRQRHLREHESCEESGAEAARFVAGEFDRDTLSGRAGERTQAHSNEACCLDADIAAQVSPARYSAAGARSQRLARIALVREDEYGATDARRTFVGMSPEVSETSSA